MHSKQNVQNLMFIKNCAISEPFDVSVKFLSVKILKILELFRSFLPHKEIKFELNVPRKKLDNIKNG